MVEWHFLRPWWLLALLPVALITFWWLRSRLSAGGWQEHIDPELLQAMTAELPKRRRNGSALGFALISTLSVVALAGPVWKQLPAPVSTTDDAWVIALDLTLSMYAEDLPPSRLERARFKILDLLQRRSEGLTGLIAYAGDAHVVTPLTDDVHTIENLVTPLEPGIMPVPGNNPRDAIRLARELMQNSGALHGQILLITDELPQRENLRGVTDADYPVSILGVGTANGAPIPLTFAGQAGRFLKNNQGQTVLPKLDVASLQSAIQNTGGRYATLSADDADLQQLLTAPTLQQSDTDRERFFDQWQEYGYWAAILTLPIILWLFWRTRSEIADPGKPTTAQSAAAITALLLGLQLLHIPVSARAATADAQVDSASEQPARDASVPSESGFRWADLWQRRDQQAIAAWKSREFDQAANLFEDPQWQAAAQYREENYEAAAGGFLSQAQQQTDNAVNTPDARYNGANALARGGQLAEALALYKQVLNEQPDHEDAQHNHDLVEKLLEEQQQNESQDQQSQQDQNDSEQSDESEQSQGSDGSQQDSESEQSAGSQQEDGADGEQPPSSDTPAESESAESEEERDSTEQQSQAEALAAEEKQELEQWLKRIPDDPGGLLRRKFKHAADQRARSGQRRNTGEKIW